MQRDEQILQWIQHGLERFAEDLRNHTVYLFGSRARGNFRMRSDFDVGVYGEQAIPPGVFYQVEDFFDSLPTLYRIDWVDLNRASAEFRREALKDAKVLYEF